MSRQKALIERQRIATGMDASRVRDWTVRTIACVGIAAACFVWTKKAVADYRVVAATGQDAPDTDTTFDMQGSPAWSNPTIDSYGHVAFRATLVDSYDADGIFWGYMPGDSMDPDRLRLVKQSSPADMSGGPYLVGGVPTIGPNGHTAFATDDATHVYDTLAVYIPPSTNTLTTAATSAGGFNGVEWTEARVNGNGKVVFRDSWDTVSIWSDGFTSLSEIAKYGDNAPGTSPTRTFTALGVPVMNTRVADGYGYAAFQAELSSSAGTGVWKQVPGMGGPVLQKVARTGDSAPGISGVNFDEFASEGRGQVGINNDGYTTFIANLAGTGVTSMNKTSIWKETSGGLTLVARDGTNLPGVAYSGIDDGSSSTPVINHEGDVAFHAGGSTETTGGIWSEGITHSLHKVAAVNDAAPGTTHALFADFAETTSLNNGGRPLAMNSFGQVAVTLRS